MVACCRWAETQWQWLFGEKMGTGSCKWLNGDILVMLVFPLVPCGCTINKNCRERKEKDQVLWHFKIKKLGYGVEEGRQSTSVLLPVPYIRKALLPYTV